MNYLKSYFLALVAAVGFGAGNYKFDKYKAEKSRKAAAGTLSLLGGASEDGFSAAAAILAGQSLARDLVNEPAAEIYPESLAAVAAVDFGSTPRIAAAPATRLTQKHFRRLHEAIDTGSEDDK